MIGNTITGDYCGISLSNTSGNALTSNDAYSNGCVAFILQNANNNTLTDNTATNGYDAFGITSSSGNTLTGNVAGPGIYDGFYLLSGADNNTLTGNTATVGYYGFTIDGSSGNTLNGNSALGAGPIGIYAVNTSTSNAITNNSAFDSTFDLCHDATSVPNTWAGNEYSTKCGDTPDIPPPVSPPAITSPTAATFATGQAGTFTVTSSGYPVAALSDGSATLPAGVTFTDNGDGTATLAGTPAAGSGGSYLFTITAHNGVTPDATQTFTLTVDQAPAITSGATSSFTIGDAGSFTVASTGFPVASLSDGGEALPSGLTFVDNGDGTATLGGTPAAGSGGVYTFTITASNGVAPNATQIFTLIVVNPMPTSADQCKNGGWKTFGVFKNQGDCVSYVETGGANTPND